MKDTVADLLDINS